MTPLPPYLLTRKARIQNQSGQMVAPFGKEYRGWRQPAMKRLYARFPNFEIQRADLIALYQEWQDPILALVATMVWGWIDTKKQQRLQQVLAVPPADLLARLNRIRDLIYAEKFGAAFTSCSTGGANHIPGIGMSYFTKTFFFIGQAKAGIKQKPLILDKWTTNAFFALLGQQASRQELQRFFSFPSLSSLNKYRAISLKADISIQATAYELFVSKMNDWATKLGVSASALEEFVFGIDLRRDKSSTNPRNELLAIIRTLIK